MGFSDKKKHKTNDESKQKTKSNWYVVFSKW